MVEATRCLMHRRTGATAGTRDAFELEGSASSTPPAARTPPAAKNPRIPPPRHASSHRSRPRAKRREPPAEARRKRHSPRRPAPSPCRPGGGIPASGRVGAHRQSLDAVALHREAVRALVEALARPCRPCGAQGRKRGARSSWCGIVAVAQPARQRRARRKIAPNHGPRRQAPAGTRMSRLSFAGALGNSPVRDHLHHAGQGVAALDAARCRGRDASRRGDGAPRPAPSSRKVSSIRLAFSARASARASARSLSTLARSTLTSSAVSLGCSPRHRPAHRCSRRVAICSRRSAIASSMTAISALSATTGMCLSSMRTRRAATSASRVALAWERSASTRSRMTARFRWTVGHVGRRGGAAGLHREEGVACLGKARLQHGDLLDLRDVCAFAREFEPYSPPTSSMRVLMSSSLARRSSARAESTPSRVAGPPGGRSRCGGPGRPRGWRSPSPLRPRQSRPRPLMTRSASRLSTVERPAEAERRQGRVPTWQHAGDVSRPLHQLDGRRRTSARRATKALKSFRRLSSPPRVEERGLAGRDADDRLALVARRRERGSRPCRRARRGEGR